MEPFNTDVDNAAAQTAQQSPTKEDNRTLYVVVPPLPLFAAHWSIFLPDQRDPNDKHKIEPTVGRRVHVEGDKLNGFGLKIIRGYDVNKHRSIGTRRYAGGAIASRHLQH